VSGGRLLSLGALEPLRAQRIAGLDAWQALHPCYALCGHSCLAIFADGRLAVLLGVVAVNVLRLRSCWKVVFLCGGQNRLTLLFNGRCRPWCGTIWRRSSSGRLTQALGAQTFLVQCSSRCGRSAFVLWLQWLRAGHAGLRCSPRGGCRLSQFARERRCTMRFMRALSVATREVTRCILSHLARPFLAQATTVSALCQARFALFPSCGLTIRSSGLPMSGLRYVSLAASRRSRLTQALGAMDEHSKT
jgi:hypothetical protein